MTGRRRQLWTWAAFASVALLLGGGLPRATTAVTVRAVAPAQVPTATGASATSTVTATITATVTATITATLAPEFTPTRTPMPTSCLEWWQIRVHIFADDVGGYDPNTGRSGCDGKYTAADKEAASYCELDNAFVVVYPAGQPSDFIGSQVLNRLHTDLDMTHIFAVCVPPPYEVQLVTTNMGCRRLCPNFSDTLRLDQSDFDKSLGKRYASVSWPMVYVGTPTATTAPTARWTPWASPTASATLVTFPPFVATTAVPTSAATRTATATVTAMPTSTPTGTATSTPAATGLVIPYALRESD